ncbi:hypothetical protein LOTGIDRAFT_173734 [Lottia gigantea]|uniref:Uncharacterized protein n=1 Tax=Lottia gigantea TaxID=225164 RepID=V4AX08_LOTGI|nr:hypothetical protein LOTGIDRAFT_173734 [Lottia gigantea]ESO99590.1 hypothetical protein LOTGIDRAFT_173734 [Lottia gigantea]
MTYLDKISLIKGSKAKIIFLKSSHIIVAHCYMDGYRCRTMNKIRSFLMGKRAILKAVDTNVRASKLYLDEDSYQDDVWGVDIPRLGTPLLEQTKKKSLFPSKQSLMSSRESLSDMLSSSPTKKRMSLFSSKESLMSSKESLSNLSTLSGVAYRRHPDDQGSRFGRPYSVGTSKACYGRFSMLQLDGIVAIDEDAKEVSISLTNLERIESIQKRAFEIAHKRRKFQRNRESKKRPLSDDDYGSRKAKVHSMIQLPSEDALLVELSKAPIVVTRKSSIQKKSWEIRLERRRKMKKRRSAGYQTDDIFVDANYT